MVKGQKKFHKNTGRGIACLGGTELKDMWVWSRLEWPEYFISGMLDDRRKAFGSKSTMLESIGILIPFIAFPEELKGRNVLFKIDNIAVYYGWYSGTVKEDKYATEILKCAQYMSGYLGSTIHVEHQPRKSDEMSNLADELSRRKTSNHAESREALENAVFRETEGYLVKWLENPKIEGKLCVHLLEELRGKVPTYGCQ